MLRTRIRRIAISTLRLRTDLFGLAGRLVFLLVVCLPFAPCRGRLTFFVLPKKVSKERRARDGDTPLDLCRGEGGEANSLRSDSLPSFSSLQQKFKAPSRAGYGHTVVALALA